MGETGLPPIDQWIRRVVADDRVVLNIDIGTATVHQGYAEVVIEADILRSRPKWHLPIILSLFEAEVPFPEAGGRVALILKHLADRQRFGIDDESGSAARAVPKCPYRRWLS